MLVKTYPKRPRPNFELKVAIRAFILTKCHKDANGYAVYDEGWSDERISEHFNAALGSVIALRRDNVGLTRRSPHDPLPERDEETERLIQQHLDTVDALVARLDKIERAYSSNMVQLDVSTLNVLARIEARLDKVEAELNKIDDIREFRQLVRKHLWKEEGA